MFDQWEALSTELRTAIVAALALLAVSLFLAVWVGYNWVKRKKITRASGRKDNGELLSAEIAYFHEKGKRDKQEDSFYISPVDEYDKNGLVVCVSDGMGGMRFGDEISHDIVNEIKGMWPLSFFGNEKTADDIRKISNMICSKYDFQGGATLAMIHIYNNYMNIYSVGDSDIILIRDGQSTILNPRQNYVSYLVKKLVREGKETQDAYINSKSRALVDFMGNKDPRVIYTTEAMKLTDGDVIIVSSDGLTDAIPWNTLAKYNHSGARKIAYTIKQTIKSKKIPKQDNYTAIMVRMSRGVV